MEKPKIKDEIMTSHDPRLLGAEIKHVFFNLGDWIEPGDLVFTAIAADGQEISYKNQCSKNGVLLFMRLRPGFFITDILPEDRYFTLGIIWTNAERDPDNPIYKEYSQSDRSSNIIREDQYISEITENLGKVEFIRSNTYEWITPEVPHYYFRSEKRGVGNITSNRYGVIVEDYLAEGDEIIEGSPVVELLCGWKPKGWQYPRTVVPHVGSGVIDTSNIFDDDFD